MSLKPAEQPLVFIETFNDDDDVVDVDNGNLLYRISVYDLKNFVVDLTQYIQKMNLASNYKLSTQSQVNRFLLFQSYLFSINATRFSSQ